ncbi:hypothetical protein TNIN_335741 [Trichonephila inaurata madagascariensis]|uniref:Uncharacterized protein n=1 Tax=Trichonephila inaurata madagascariensis TaxID=2747483 RepID=A0A8X6Y0A6_9ARAC|nr:hypothetical protein TNIN_335741 [Trichonephila inaurata madagascariensis]
MRCKLLRNLSRKDNSNALIVFAIAKNIHQYIENAITFVSFLAYVLTSGKIIQAISLIVTDYMSDEESIKIMHWYIVPIWTVTWFVVLTMCGTQAKKNESCIKTMSQ